MTDSKKVILLIESSRGFGRDLMKGVARYASLFGPWTFYHRKFFYLDNSFSARARKTELEHLKRWGANGVIAREFSSHTRQEIISLGIPAVISTVFNESLETNTGNIFVDNHAIGKMAAAHLIERGFTNFAFCGLDDFFWSRDRLQGFADEINKTGCQVQVYQQPQSRQKRLWDNEQHILGDWLASLAKPTGLMACIDERAQDVIQACRQISLHIPEELAIISGDNDELICELSNPQLSSVAINGEQVGYDAAELLDNLMHDRVADDTTVTVRPTHVVARHSTDILAVSDSDVVLALQFIKQHCREQIQVQDVADHIAMTRQGLNKKFHQILGRPINVEIKRVRIQQIIRLLIETGMNISEIAAHMGFLEQKLLSQYFRRETGLSPLQYRKKFRP